MKATAPIRAVVPAPRLCARAGSTLNFGVASMFGHALNSFLVGNTGSQDLRGVIDCSVRSCY